MSDALAALTRVLAPLPRLAVAVSGGVDSLTLAFVASRVISDFRCIHAVSPSVPPAATERVKKYARRYDWSLDVVESGEFADPNYRSNPHNRCYFCKQNLYGMMAARFDGPLASGTNLDDLGDYRPGLIAAREFGVRHPFVEAKIGKGALREIAREFGLEDIAALPAQPCLSSRITTGLQIREADLQFVDRIEKLLRPHVTGGDLRCRITPQGVKIEATDLSSAAEQLAREACKRAGRFYLGVRPYARGSAFLRPDADAD
jgi:uncharacterized protein